ncbi:hypothetical protein COLO4_10539 [Corchorus olitorius]|uniref:F-box domain-containing protein n=1 Tax=Corchorus olitorius TaxID=93759 RepID=A0A1R3K854_9ROSI|nr:hypothetical protein COLO4_10539 [Corchorus olitorius]
MDWLSDLPDSILSHILSFLPTTKEAAQTSVLSTRWRNLYASANCLKFYDNEWFSDQFIAFVNRVLLLHGTAPIEEFSLEIVQEIDFDYFDLVRGWLIHVLNQSVQNLCFAPWYGADATNLLPTSLFSSKTLVNLSLIGLSNVTIPQNVSLPSLNTLKLEALFNLTIPGEVCFPSLKTIFVQDEVCFRDDKSFQSLVSCCLVLEELFIFHYDSLCYPPELCISNPSLKRLTLQGDSNKLLNLGVDAPSLVYLNLSYAYVLGIGGSYSLVNLQSLVIVDFTNMDFDDLFEEFEHFGIQCRDIAIGLLAGITNVQSLYISSALLRHPLKYRNLVLVEIIRPSIGYGNREGLVELLEMTPNLRTLIFRQGVFERLIWDPPKRVASCFFSHIKVIEVYSFDGEATQMEMIEYFLKNACVLESLKVQLRMKGKKRVEIAKKLLTLPRESKMCIVKFV